VRGRPKRNPGRPAERCAGTTRRRTELALRVGVIVAWLMVGNTVWRIKRRPV